MKICPACQKSYGDFISRCISCGEDLTNVRSVESQNNYHSDTEHHSERPVKIETPSKPININSEDDIFGSDQFDISPEEHRPVFMNHRPFDPGSFRRYSGLLTRVILPLLLIIGSVIFIIVNIETIKLVIAKCIVGAIAGALIAGYLSRRSINPERYIGWGAIGGAVLWCAVSFNLFNVNAELSDLISGVFPIVLMIGGIIFIIRSIR